MEKQEKRRNRWEATTEEILASFEKKNLPKGETSGNPWRRDYAVNPLSYNEVVRAFCWGY